MPIIRTPCILLVGHVYCCSCLVCVLLSYVYLLYYVCIAVFTLAAGLLAISQYSEGPATGHLDTGFSWFPCVYKQMLRWFPRIQVATTCFSCSPPDLNLLVTDFMLRSLPYHPSCLHCPDALSMVGDALSGNGCGSPKSHVVIFTQFIVDD